MQKRTKYAMVGALLALAVALGACGATSGEPEPPYATLVMENGSMLTVNVYAVAQNMPYRLGTVSGMDSAVFPIQARMLSATRELQIMIDPLGRDRNYYGDPIAVSRGDTVRVDVSSFLR